ncbi:hypothetical protein KAF44_26355 (plasmid) [Cupriavidus necator]|nr:hypothetical protein KAF44_26355 [Cupriavidus necator]
MFIHSRVSGTAVLAVVAMLSLALSFESAQEVKVSPDAACLHHQLVVEMDGMRTYINTNPKALRRLHLQVAAA